MLEILENFDWFVNSIDGDIAYISLLDENGHSLMDMQIPSEELKISDVKEQQSFNCKFVTDDNNHSKIEIVPIDFKELLPEEVKEISNKLDVLFGDYYFG